jgi:hypothetical protein
MTEHIAAVAGLDAESAEWPRALAGTGPRREEALARLHGLLARIRIGQLTGLDRQRVARLLRKSNVSLRPKGAGAVQPPRRRGEPANLPEILAELYVHRHLTIRQIGELLGIPTATVRNRLRRHGSATSNCSPGSPRRPWGG